MHISQFLFPAIFSTCVSAFYPYIQSSVDLGSSTQSHSGRVRRSPFFPWTPPKHDSVAGDASVPTLSIRKAAPKAAVEPRVRRALELASIDHKYAVRAPLPTDAKDVSTKKHKRSRLPWRRSNSKRNNAYPEVDGAQPTQANSMAINTDGTDLSYFSTVKFGSSGKPLRMLVDTGAANTWVMGSDCQSKACKTHDTFGNTDSSTLEVTEQDWSVTYGSGNVSGVIVKDTVALAGATLEMSFGSASSTSDDFLSYPMDGILGLGRPDSNSLDVPSLTETLAKSVKLKANLFGINLQRTADGAIDGELSFGEPNTSKYQGDLSWTSTASTSKLWEIPVDDAGANGKTVGFKGKTAIVDTGTSFILLPTDDAKRLHAQLDQVTQNGETFMLPCSTNVPIQFTISGVTYDVSPKDYVGNKVDGNTCQSNIIGHQTFGADQWLLGDAFLKNVYTVFDFDQNRVGFGKKQASSQVTKTSSATSSITNSGPISTSMTASPIPPPTSATPSSSTPKDPSAVSQTSSSSSSASTPTSSGPESGVGRTLLVRPSISILAALSTLMIIFAAGRI